MTTLIPDTPVTRETLAEWYKTKVALGQLKSKEGLLRSKIFKYFFPAPVEGSNKAFDDNLLGPEYRIVAKVPVTRDVDAGVLQAMIPQLREAGISVDKLIRYKPELELKEYRKLSEEERQLFDQCLTIKDGSPQVEITPKTSRD